MFNIWVREDKNEYKFHVGFNFIVFPPDMKIMKTNPTEN
jgi:hypothetical protein